MIDTSGARPLDDDTLLLQAIGDDRDLWADLLASPAPLDGPFAPHKPPASTPSPVSPFSSSNSALGSPMDVDMAAFSPQPSVNSADLELESIRSLSGDEQLQGDHDAGVSSASPAAASVPADGTKSRLSALWEQEDAGMKVSAKPDGPPSPLLWADPTPALMHVDAPNADTMDVRRMKNREFMRRARQRQREGYKHMKATVERLEKQYAELCIRAAPGLDDALVVSSPSSSNVEGDEHKEQQQRRYVAMLTLAKRLRAENLYLKAGLQQHATWKQDLHRILDSTIDPSNDVSDAFRPSAGSPLSSPASSSARRTGTPLSRPMVLNFDVLDTHEAESLFHFSPLDAPCIARVIVDNTHETQKIRSAVMAAVNAKDPRVKRHDMLGWDVIQRVRGNLLEYTYTKTFRDLDVDQAGQNMWMNDMQLDTFRVILYSLHRLEVLQRISTNNYILGRDVKAPDRNTVFRSLFMRFRTQVSREIPNGSLPPIEATGFVIGSHSLNRDWSNVTSLSPYQSYYPGDGSARPAGLHDGEALEWADFVYATEFLTIKNPTTGETYHQIQWIGRSDFKSHDEALRNAPDALTVCLRTEMLMFRPAFQLRAISDGDAR